MNQFEIYQNKDGKYRFRLKIGDQIIVCSDFYKTPAAVRNHLTLCLQNATEETDLPEHADFERISRAVADWHERAWQR